MSGNPLRTDDRTPRYDIGFDMLYRLDDDADSEWAGLVLHFSVDYVKSADENPSIGDLVANLSITPHEGQIPDERAEWHRNYTSPKRWIRAHVYRLAMGWQETQLANELEERPELAKNFGFIDDDLGSDAKRAGWLEACLDQGEIADTEGWRSHGDDGVDREQRGLDSF